MTANVNGKKVSFGVQCYALKAVFRQDDGGFMYNKYTINGIDEVNGGVYFQVIDSTSLKTSFNIEDFDNRLVYYHESGNSYPAIDATLEITKEESDLLCGYFNMQALKEDNDTIRITDGCFELSLETQNIIIKKDR